MVGQILETINSPSSPGLSFSASLLPWCESERPVTRRSALLPRFPSESALHSNTGIRLIFPVQRCDARRCPGTLSALLIPNHLRHCPYAPLLKSPPGEPGGCHLPCRPIHPRRA